MKRTIFSLIAAAIALTSFAGTPIKYNTLPETSRAFISVYLPNAKTTEIERDTNNFGAIEYEIEFSNGVDVKFNAKGEWIQYNTSGATAVLESIIPKNIARYVVANYPDRKIVEIKRNPMNYEVELTGDINLYFANEASNENQLH